MCITPKFLWKFVMCLHETAHLPYTDLRNGFSLPIFFQHSECLWTYIDKMKCINLKRFSFIFIDRPKNSHITSLRFECSNSKACSVQCLMLICVYIGCFIRVNVSGFNLTRVMKWKQHIKSNPKSFDIAPFFRQFQFSTAKIVSWIGNFWKYFNRCWIFELANGLTPRLSNKSFVCIDSLHTLRFIFDYFFHWLGMICSIQLNCIEYGQNVRFQIKINPSKSHLNFFCFSLLSIFFSRLRYFAPARKIYITVSIKIFQSKRKKTFFFRTKLYGKILSNKLSVK